MDEGVIENNGNAIRTVKSNLHAEKEIARSVFEKQLFEGGVYEFDFDNEIAKSKREHDDYQAWLRKAQPLREKESLERFIGDERHQTVWKQSFSGKIPKHWGEVWHKVMHDIEEAGNQRVQLSETLVNAGASHDHHLVVNATGKNQRLNARQLGFVFASDIPQWNTSEIVAEQKTRGMTEEEIREAEDVAAELRKKMRRKNTPKKQIQQPKKILGIFKKRR